MADTMYSCRDQLNAVDLGRGSHPGLMLQKYLRVQDSPDDKTDLMKMTVKAAANIDLDAYREAFERWEKSLGPFKDNSLVLKVENRMVVGLGGENVLEAGLTIHHTYGVPYIPGSAIKGLAAHYCDQVLGEIDEDFQKGNRVHRAIFGTTDEAGLVVFHDAWIFPDSVKTRFIAMC